MPSINPRLAGDHARRAPDPDQPGGYGAEPGVLIAASATGTVLPAGTRQRAGDPGARDRLGDESEIRRRHGTSAG
ncbi:MAG: hypothetical protein WDN72_08245 [Alphaproteobacteria bacterium]